MNTSTWVKSNVDYGRKLVESGLAGADCGRKEFLQREPLRPFLGESARKALKFSAAATCVGMGAALLTQGDRKKTLYTVALAFAGAALGFATGVTWESRQFLASIARQAIKDVNATRDEHWLQTNPIDYA